MGMHRSGTSFLSGMLSFLGCSKPATLMKPSISNEKGYFESKAICDLLDEILASAGSNWNDWRAFDLAWGNSPLAEPFIDQLAELVTSEFLGSNLFVLKNPRFCRLMPLSLAALSRARIRSRFIHIHRDPQEVAASLQDRNDMNIKQSQLLWLRHCLDAEVATRDLPRYFTNYNRLMTDWHGDLQTFQDISGQKLPISLSRAAQNITEFKSPSLRHFDQSQKVSLTDPPLLDWTLCTLDILNSWAGTAGNSVDFPELDRIRSEFNAASENFGSFISNCIQTDQSVVELAKATENGSQLRLKLEQATKTLEKRDEEVKASKDSVEELTRTQDELRQKLEQATKTLEKRDEEVEKTNKELENLQSELSTRISALKQRSQEAKQTFDKLTAVKNEVLTLQENEIGLSSELAMLREQLQHEQNSHAEHTLTYQSQLRMQEVSIRHRFEELAKLANLVIELQSREQNWTDRNADLKANLSESREKLNAAWADKQEILSSNSWRLTAPMRKIKDIIRKGPKG